MSPSSAPKRSRFWIMMSVYLLVFLALAAFFYTMHCLLSSATKTISTIQRPAGGRANFATIIVLIDPSGSMSPPMQERNSPKSDFINRQKWNQNFLKSLHLAENKVIPACGAGDKCSAYAVRGSFNPGNEIFPCPMIAGVTTCKNLPDIDARQALETLNRAPYGSSGIRATDRDQKFINTLPALREKEAEVRTAWAKQVRGVKPPDMGRDDRSDICGALEAIGREFEGSRAKEKWFIAMSDLDDDVNYRGKPCPQGDGDRFRNVMVVLLVPFERLRPGSAFEKQWRHYFSSAKDIQLQPLATASEIGLQANPTMGLERFETKSIWTHLVECLTWWRH